MKRTNNKLIYTGDGERTHFFYSDKEGICMADKEGTKVLFGEGYKDFDVCMLSGIIYLVCQNADGDIILLKNFNNEWHKYTLFVSKTKLCYEKNFCLLMCGECIQLFYTIRSLGRVLLIEQLLGEQTSEPIVVDALGECGGKTAFCAVNDEQKNTYVYYQSERGVFGYKMYKWSLKAFGEFMPVIDEACIGSYALIDDYGRHHLCILHERSISYIRRNLDGEYSIRKSIDKVYDVTNAPYISIEEEKIYIVWLCGYMVTYSVSTDDGETFCAPVKMMSTGEEPMQFFVQKESFRFAAFAGFVQNELRFIKVGGGEVAYSKPRGTVRENYKKPSQQDSEINRLKQAVAELSRQVSDIKNKLNIK